MQKPEVELTDQLIFDLIANHLLTQNQKSVDSRRLTCLYYGPNGLKCAAGVLIPPEAYHSGIEGTGLRPNDRAYDIFNTLGYNHRQIELIRELQYLHDNVSCFDWLSHLYQLADTLDLSPEVLDAHSK